MLAENIPWEEVGAGKGSVSLCNWLKINTTKCFVVCFCVYLWHLSFMGYYRELSNLEQRLSLVCLEEQRRRKLSTTTITTTTITTATNTKHQPYLAHIGHC